MAHVRAARQWCVDNPRNRKTSGRMAAFLTGWLNRTQNSGRHQGTNGIAGTERHKARVPTDEELETWTPTGGNS
jgi:hypothetical protein